MKYLKYLIIALKYAILTLVIVCAVAAGTLLAYRAIERKRLSAMREITGSGGISSLEKVTIGGVPQWIQIRGWNKDHPVLLFVHGGPGFTDMPFYYRFDTLLENDFVVVHWDQRGAGKSYGPAIDPGTMTTGQFVKDTIELSEMLNARFGKKVYLAGHSWGSLVGILAAARRPGLYEAYIGIGQVTDMTRDDGASYRFALGRARMANNMRAVRQLQDIGPPPWTARRLFIERKWVTRFGGAFHALSYGKIFDIAALSPAYTLSDLYGLFKGLRSSMRMYGDMQAYDVTKAVPELKVPAYFMEGKYDRITPPELVRAYYEALKAPKKEFIVFNESGHFPQWEEPEEFHEAMVKRVLGEKPPDGTTEP